MSQYSDNSFLYCPGIHCTFESCIECADADSGEYDTSQCCCNGRGDPCCHDCSLIFCPIAMVLDMISFPYRCISYKCKKNKENNVVKETSVVVDEQPNKENNVVKETSVVVDEQPK
jgi:hypothetical protein